MSSQVLARKWRPTTFSQVVGQTHALQALSHALDEQRLHHAYLLSGTRGVGKTTLARLFAKGLNCEQGTSSSPCGSCSSCEEISEGRFVDLIEIDAASRTKVDDTREILDNVQYLPTRARYKVYLIDEVHMLSRSSFNALLKTLEEPPEHVKFLLATTEPQRLPITVLSRCFQFHLKSLSTSQIEQQIVSILQKEEIAFEQKALQLISKKAQGSMRDALSLTDQAIAYGAGSVGYDTVQSMLGTLSTEHAFTLLNAVLQKQPAVLLQDIENIFSTGAQADAMLVGLIELCHQIYLIQRAPQALSQDMKCAERLKIAQDICPEQLLSLYQSLVKSRKYLPYAADSRSGLEVALLSLISLPEVASNKVQEALPVVEKKSTDAAVSAMPATDSSQDLAQQNSLDAQMQHVLQQAQDLKHQVSQSAPEAIRTLDHTLAQQDRMGTSSRVSLDIPQPNVNMDRQDRAVEPLDRAVVQETAVDQTVVAAKAAKAAKADINADPAHPQTMQDETQALLHSVIKMRQQLMQQVEKASSATCLKAPELVRMEEDTASLNVNDTPIYSEQAVRSQQNASESLEHHTTNIHINVDDVPTVSKAIDNSAMSSEPHLEQLLHDIDGLHPEDHFWFTTIMHLRLGGRAQQLVSHSWLHRDAQNWCLKVSHEQKHLASSQVIQSLDEALSKLQNAPIQVTVESADVQGHMTPFMVRKQLKILCKQQAEARIKVSDDVLFILDRFDAQIMKDSVEYPSTWIDPER